MKPRFEVFQNKMKEWKFRLRAGNGKIIAFSQTYLSKRNAILGIESIQECAPDADVLYKDN